MKMFRAVCAIALAAAGIGLSSAPLSAAPMQEPDHPNNRVIQLPARAFPVVYDNVSPERSYAPDYSGTILTPDQTRALRDSGAPQLARSMAPYNYNELGRLIQEQANIALAQNPDGCIRVYYKPRGKNPNYPAFYVAAVSTKFCTPPYLIP